MNEIQLCLSEMRTFFLSGTTQDVTWRKKQLITLRQSISQYETTILKALYADLGKSDFEGFATELGIVYAEIDHHLKHLDSWTKKHRVRSTILTFPSSAFTIAQPLGIVLIMSPWNYPFQLTLAPLVAAIAAGNCVILKPSRYSEHTSQVIEEMLAKAFLSNYIATFQGGSAMNTELLSHRFDHIFFTGSPNVGKIVMESAAKHLTPVTLELGGKSPVIIDAGINVKLAAKRIAWGKFINAGQTCVAPDYVLVKRELLETFVEELKKSIQVMYGTNPLNNSDYPKIINQKHFDRLLELLTCGTLAYGGQLDPKALKIAPTIITEPNMDSNLMTDEIFGPILPIIPYDNFEQTIEFIQNREHPLALYLFSDNKTHQDLVVNNLIYGGGCINDTIVHLVNVHMAFGGVGSSGMGSYHAKAGFNTFSHTKSILKKGNWLDVPLRYPPFKGKFSLLKRLMK
ncbi:MAG: aldehyde dehydrogenase [Sphaerochaeta sp.]